MHKSLVYKKKRLRLWFQTDDNLHNGIDWSGTISFKEISDNTVLELKRYTYMETTMLMILMASALLVLAIVLCLLILYLFRKGDELKEKNDVIVREVRRNQQLIDRAVQLGVKRGSMLS